MTLNILHWMVLVVFIRFAMDYPFIGMVLGFTGLFTWAIYNYSHNEGVKV